MKTRYHEIEIKHIENDLWMYIVEGSQVGPHFATRAEALAYLDTYAIEYGCDNASKVAMPVAFDGFVPNHSYTDPNGEKWLQTNYERGSSYAGIDPWNWPMYVRYDNILYKKSGFNSDNKTIYYRESKEPNTAIATS